MKIIVTGGAGFIGSAVIRYLIQNTEHNVINVDKLTYAGNLDSLKDIGRSPNYVFMQSDICDASHMDEIFETVQPDLVMHLAAESHVDRSIEGSAEFIHTNIIGTHTLLEAARKYWQNSKKENFRFHHISTDEVYGDLEAHDPAFTETTAYAPSSPYSASKASADHLIFSYFQTFNFPSVILRPSNNYGPYQFPEKLIPLIILNAIEEKKLSIYGTGKNVRNWLYIDDDINAIKKIMLKGKIGDFYNIGGQEELTNIELVTSICRKLDVIKPRKNKKKYESLIIFVKDRPGHDLRYSLDSKKICNEINWKPKIRLSRGLELTIKWYLENKNWWNSIRKFKYKGERLGN